MTQRVPIEAEGQAEIRFRLVYEVHVYAKDQDEAAILGRAQLQEPHDPLFYLVECDEVPE